MVPVTDFLTGYVVPAGTGLAGDPSLKASRHSTGGAMSVFETSIGAFGTAAGSFVSLPQGRPHRFWATGPAVRLLLITVPGSIEGYFAEINAASSDAERGGIGERHGIRVVPG